MRDAVKCQQDRVSCHTYVREGPPREQKCSRGSLSMIPIPAEFLDSLGETLKKVGLEMKITIISVEKKKGS